MGLGYLDITGNAFVLLYVQEGGVLIATSAPPTSTHTSKWSSGVPLSVANFTDQAGN
jgi:hypothetical protein